MFIFTEQGKVRKVQKVQITKDYFLKIVETTIEKCNIYYSILF